MLEIVSVGADETTDVSLVGKFPTADPFAFTPGPGEVGGELAVDETTDASSVANFVGALAAGEAHGEAAAAMGDGSENPVAAPFC